MNIWPPPDLHAVPSKEEIQKAKEEIASIELEIVETQLRLDALRKSLAERKVWIAPIRAIPHDILYPIFVEVSKDDWKAPLALQSVCRRWRELVVDSPEAWAFMPLSNYSFSHQSSLMLLFLGRSRNIPLHVFVNGIDILQYMEHLEDRIECIHLRMPLYFTEEFLQDDYQFRGLKRLTIEMWSPCVDELQVWDMLSFPNLQLLEINSNTMPFLTSIAASPEFPAIRQLVVRCGNPLKLPQILAKCAKSLEYVDLTYSAGGCERLDEEYTIRFPRLAYLRLEHTSRSGASNFGLNVVAPKLQIYLDQGAMSTMDAIQVRSKRVRFMCALRTPELSHYPSLTTLCLIRASRPTQISHHYSLSVLTPGDIAPGEEEVMKAIDRLKDNPTLCPKLASIESIGGFTTDELAKGEAALLVRENVTGRQIQLKSGTKKNHKHCTWELKGLYRCGNHMPCNADLFDT